MTFPRHSLDVGLTQASATDKARRMNKPQSSSPVASWRDHFPVGVFADPATAAVRTIGGGAAHAIAIQTVSQVPEALAHPDSGIAANNLRYLMLVNSSWQGDQSGGLHSAYEANRAGGHVWTVAGPNTELNTDWFNNEGIGHTDGQADAVAGPIVSFYEQHPGVLAYYLLDDVNTSTQAGRVATLSRAFDRAGTKARPATGAYISITARDAILNGCNTPLLFTAHYPVGYDLVGNPMPEGDFHQGVWGGLDSIDVIESDFGNAEPRPVARWMILQAHQVGGTGIGALRYPTPNEMKAQFWDAIGYADYVKGIFWFQWPDQAATWDGLGSAASAARLRAAHELADRLTPEIRARLLPLSTAPSQKFTASGGGNTGYAIDYADAFVRTLYHAAADTYYCVVRNHSTSTANVTISSASLSGDLVNLETGTRYALPATVSLAALDGTIFVHDPAYGVPPEVLDVSLTPRQWRQQHWAYRGGPNYRSPASIRTWPNVVSVGAGANLQAAVDAAPDRTTFSLAAGATYGRVVLIGRSHLAFVSANPANKATVRGFELHTHEHALRYHTVGAVSGWIDWVLPERNNDLESQEALLHGARDIVLKDLKLIQEPGFCAILQPNGRTEYVAVYGMGMRDVLIEGCDVSGYKAADAGGNCSNAPTFHFGNIIFSSGVRNVVVRECSLAGANNDGGYAFPWSVYMDGPRGCAVCYNDLPNNDYGSGFLFLTNDDLTADYDRDGMVDVWDEARNAKYVAVFGNTTKYLGTFVSYSGEHGFVCENTLNLGLNGYTFMEIGARASRLWATHRHYYVHAGTEVADNTVLNGGYPINGFVRHDTFSEPNGASVGNTTLTGNRVQGDVSTWIVELNGPTGILSNNTESDNLDNWTPP